VYNVQESSQFTSYHASLA